MSKPKTENPSKQAVSWRTVLPIHPAAELFPLMKDENPEAPRALADDIKEHGLEYPVIVQLDQNGDPVLIDGRNRLDALALLGMEIDLDDPEVFGSIRADVDPYAFVITANIHRRHLSVELKRDIAAELLKAAPQKSNRRIGESARLDHHTVARIRAQMEARGEIPHVETRTDTKGREQQARKPPPKSPATTSPQVAGNAVDPEASAAQRKAEAAEDNEARQAKTPGEMLFSLLTTARDLLPAHSADEIRALVATIPERQRAEWADIAEWLIRLGGRLKLDLERRAEINDPPTAAPAAAPTRAAPPVELPEIPPFLDRRTVAPVEPDDGATEPTKH